MRVEFVNYIGILSCVSLELPTRTYVHKNVHNELLVCLQIRIDSLSLSLLYSVGLFSSYFLPLAPAAHLLSPMVVVHRDAFVFFFLFAKNFRPVGLKWILMCNLWDFLSMYVWMDSVRE